MSEEVPILKDLPVEYQNYYFGFASVIKEFSESNVMATVALCEHLKKGINAYLRTTKRLSSMSFFDQQLPGI